jgi:hypothetical protein
VSDIVPYVSPIFNVWFEYPVLLLFRLTSCMCSLYLVLNVLPVCLTYCTGQSRLLIQYMSLLLYLSICGGGLSIPWIVFSVRNATFTLVSRKIIASLTSLPLYVKVTHYVFWFGNSSHAFCFFLLINLVLLLRSMFMMVLLSVFCFFRYWIHI